MKHLGLTGMGTGVLVLALLFATSQAHAVTRSEILGGYKAELKQAYNDPSLNPAATAICQLIARRLHPILPDTSQLDYDLDEKQNKYFDKIAIQLDLDRKTRGLVAWRIFRDACKVEAGYYKEPSRWNGWRHDIWSKVRTQQEQVEYEKELVHIKEARAREEAARKAFRKAEESYRQVEQKVRDIVRKAERQVQEVQNTAYQQTKALLDQAEQQAREIKSKARQQAQQIKSEAYKKAINDKGKAKRQASEAYLQAYDQSRKIKEQSYRQVMQRFGTNYTDQDSIQASRQASGEAQKFSEQAKQQIKDTKDRAIKQAEEEKKEAYKQAGEVEQKANRQAEEIVKQAKRQAEAIRTKAALHAEEELKRTTQPALEDQEKARELYDRAKKVYYGETN